MQGREMQGISSITACLSPPQISLHQDLQNNNNNTQIQHQQHGVSTSSRFDHRLNVNPNDFLDQMLSTLPSWNDLQNPNSSPWDLHSSQNTTPTSKLFSSGMGGTNTVDDSSPYDESTLLASRLRQHQISSTTSPKSMLLQQQQLLLSRSNGIGGDSSGLFPIPLTLGNNGDSLSGGSSQSYGVPTAGMNQVPSVGTSGSNPVKQKVRARRGQATDPHSIAERLRRERIADRMKALQELVPNANKTDKASMLDEIIDYVKFLQLQVKVLSMSRLGGAAAVAPLVAGTSSEGCGDCIQGNGGAKGRTASSSNDSITVTENKVAELMEGGEMGQAMQYLQGKGLCLMPITLAKAIQSTTCHTRNIHHNSNSLLGASNIDGPSSPNMSVLTVQSATMGNGETSLKDATSITKP
ncbi:hypothetical protein GIB67_013082 [Kingdonia uniflora]|uniref:BHLH domain-containing protein n=1 Tax=Kingdonia uniflora TaxID=39325 RepID=A0A7J7LX80_9MAGN|nr:hypothetical protein GIB67_013082 [Kingdonia uniflora]